MNISQQHQPIKRSSTPRWLWGACFVALVALSLSLLAYAFPIMPADTAWGAVAGAKERAERAGRESGSFDVALPSSNHEIDYEQFLSTRTYEQLLSDDATGVVLGRYVDADSQEEEPDPPPMESIDLLLGEGCLHAQGECEACDELREMHREGEVDALCRVAVIPDIEAEGQFSVDIPLDERVDKLAVYRCDDGVLRTSYRTAGSGTDAVRIDSDAHGVQSPLGIAYNKDKPEEPKAATAHAYVPDDDGDDDAGWQKVLSGIMIIAVFFAGMLCILRIEEWVLDRIAKRRLR